MNKFLSSLLHLIFPATCPMCSSIVDNSHEKTFCSKCFEKITFIGNPLCIQCGLPFKGTSDDHLCGDCMTDTRYFDKARSICLYQEPLSLAIQRFKYQKRISFGSPLGLLIKNNVHRFFDLHIYDRIIPVPLHKKKLRQRGFNQSLILIRSFSHKDLSRKIDYSSLKRIRYTLPQTTLKVKERRENIKDAFVVNSSAMIDKKKILLVDDIFTTGVTVNECSRVLRKAGALRIDVLTLARAV